MSSTTWTIIMKNLGHAVCPGTAAVVIALFSAGAGTALGQGAGGGAAWHKGALNDKGVTINPLELERQQPAKVWQAKAPAGAPVKPYNARIVGYGDDWTRRYMGDHGGNRCLWRMSDGPFLRRSGSPYVIKQDVDLDGDGQTADDYIESIPFLPDQPFGIPEWPYSGCFPERFSSQFHGGVSWYLANTVVGKARTPEIGINIDHSCFMDGRDEDHPLCGVPDVQNANSALQMYNLFLWKKAIFFNCRPEWKVTFDENSVLASVCTRGYWYGYDDTRMVVQDPEGLWISDTDQFDIPKKAYAPYPGRVFELKPTKATWAKYEPKEHLIHFDASKAKFEKRTFQDVQGVGWYLAKNNNAPGGFAHVKWYGFESHAVIHRPKAPSANIEMPAVPGTAEAPAFYMANCEVPYSFWRIIHKYGEAPFHTLEPRYVYRWDGAMGSMYYGEQRHGPEEPVTHMDWYDALAWCNTLSEYEGRTPCYYLDEARTQVFRNDHIQTRAVANSDPKKNPIFEPIVAPKIYVKWEADGHRLPTIAEFLQAWKAGKQGAGVRSDDRTTHAVGSRPANRLGLYDLADNVWEMVWSDADTYDPQVNVSVVVMGGDFRGGTDPLAVSASPYGDRPSGGSWNIGIRPVSRDAGLKAPAAKALPKEAVGALEGAPYWRIEKTTVTQAGKAAEAKKGAPIEMVNIKGGTINRYTDGLAVKVHAFAIGKTPVTYTQWKTVRQWAEAKGYTFSRQGDMGSMRTFNFEHSPDEPVTAVTWHDAVVWCNALSEMEGRTPVYYVDPEYTGVYRQTQVFRPLQYDCREWMKSTAEKPHPYIAKKYLDKRCENVVFERWDVDGYRLPTSMEYEYAAFAGTDKTTFWAKDFKSAAEYGWTSDIAGGRTHPVGLKKPNPFGLYDMVGNALVILNSSPAHFLSSSSRRRDLDLNNPKDSRFTWWHEEKLSYDPKVTHGHMAGSCSWLSGDPLESKTGPLMNDFVVGGFMYYADMSLRVLRCEKGTHPKDGREPLLDPTKLRFDPKEFNELRVK